ncbi:serine/threonine protein kinase [Actinoplanes sp. RD1]|uniref:serine/threonine protein kinase n=1 Tax=Actinoplanes sp. RD1 TaxID=3064538 RepID=UPI0027413291|nr:serine/threonine protein kinase [Actinoplanes sp. RD1]
MSPLRQGDPEQLGRYRLTGRLGSGGMGVVYLARDTDGTYVAIKQVHVTLINDPEFRGRFRSEVERAKQVPPFATAEVLDYDLDHQPPYLVVEYVDGPSLAEVVEDRGPLRSAALHSLAVGVATALSGIHGAGVIHRDLKPDNVLLAPGSPKVIDFGIARAFEATSQHTRTDQMVGTVAYMAPERFSSEPGTPLTAAADIFAWGCVVAYAGTGRTPFHGDSPPATAGRILTQPPYLEGLAEPLRGLVELTLSKDPADRPTARELLDMLLGDAPVPRQTSAAPAPAAPAETHAAAPRPAETHAASPRPAGGPHWAVPAPGLLRGEAPADPYAPSWKPSDAYGLSAGPYEHYQSVPGTDRRRARRGKLVAAFAVLLVAAGLGTTGLVLAQADESKPPVRAADSGGAAGVGAAVPGSAVPSREPAPGSAPATDPQDYTAPEPSRAATRTAKPKPSATTKPTPREPTGGEPIIQDPLNQPGQWLDSEIREQQANCFTKDVMRAGRVDRGTYQCVGPDESVTDDFGVEVTTSLQSAGSCAAIWFHWADDRGGDVLRVCQDEISVAADKPDSKTVFDKVTLRTKIALKKSVRIHAVMREGSVQVFRNGAFVTDLDLPAAEPDSGQIRLGISVEAVDATPPYTVHFANVDIRSL